MLIAVLSGMVCLSVLWVVTVWHYAVASMGGISLLDAGVVNVALYGLLICLPILVGWWIFGAVCQSMYNRKMTQQMKKLFAQMKKNQEYSDLLARIMLGSEQDNKNAFELGRFDLLLADLNELLSDFISRQRLASEEQIEYLWTRVQNGGKWSFGKVIIENFNRQPNFKQKVLVNVLADNVLAGTVLEFCARYQKIVELLEKYDKEKVFYDMMETGVMGKVFAIMTPLVGEIRRARDGNQSARPIINRASDESPVNTKDSFSLALERSFGSESSFDGVANTTSGAFLNNEDVSETQRVIDSLKKEWKDNGNTVAQKDVIGDLTYPFGSWTDEQNYRK